MYQKRKESKFVKHAKQIGRYSLLLNTSLRYQGQHFFENSTLHGIRYVAEDGRPIIEKLMWLSCVIVGTVATIIIIISLWGKFQTNPTITGLDTDFHSWDVPFPALTLCDIDEPHNETYIDEFLASKWPSDDESDIELRKEFLYMLPKLNYQLMRNLTKYIDHPKLAGITQDLKSLIFETVKHCEDLLSDCYWKNEAYNCCSGFYPIFTENGFCYTYNSREFEPKWPWLQGNPPVYDLQYIQETDVAWSFEFSSTSKKMLVYIHNSDEAPSIDSNPQHIWDQKVNKLSFSVKHTYTTEDARQLSIKQRHCIYEDEVKLKIDKVMYTYTACTRQCRMETSKKLCGCIPYFYPQIDGFKYCTLKQMTCVITNLERIISVEKCRCELGCSNTVYEVEKLTERSDPSENSLESEFVSWPMVRYKREVLFGWVDLLVSFGGIAGLFLGFSLLSGVEIIYYFTIRTWCMVYRDREEVEKIMTEQKVKKKIENNNIDVTTPNTITLGHGFDYWNGRNNWIRPDVQNWNQQYNRSSQKIPNRRNISSRQNISSGLSILSVYGNPQNFSGYRNSQNFSDQQSYRNFQNFSDQQSYKNALNILEQQNYKNSQNFSDQESYRNSQKISERQNYKNALEQRNNRSPYDSGRQNREVFNKYSNIRSIAPQKTHKPKSNRLHPPFGIEFLN